MLQMALAVLLLVVLIYLVARVIALKPHDWIGPEPPP